MTGSKMLLFVAALSSLACASPTLQDGQIEKSIPQLVDQHTAEPTPAASILAKREHLQAIATRSARGRSTAPPTETFIRRYQSNGVVISETVKQGETWADRPSTLSTELARAPLSEFTSSASGQGRLCASGACQPISGSTTQEIHDSVSGATDLVVISGVIDSAAAHSSARWVADISSYTRRIPLVPSIQS